MRIFRHVQGTLVEVEVDVANGPAAFTILGLPDAAVNESRERIRSAIQNSGAQMGPAEVGECCQVELSVEKLLESAMQQLHLSSRAFQKVLKVARTIADLAESEMIPATHVVEMLQYRPRLGI